MALTPDRERELLSDYAAALADAIARRDEAQAEVDSLDPIVEGLRKRVGDEEPVYTPFPTYKGKPVMAAVIAELFVDDTVRTVDDVVDHFEDHDAYRDKPPSRTSITNRLNDLVKAHELMRVGRGRYQAPPRDEEDGG